MLLKVCQNYIIFSIKKKLFLEIYKVIFVTLLTKLKIKITNEIRNNKGT